MKIEMRDHKGSFRMPVVDVWTYGQEKKKKPGEVRVKRIMTPEQYVFSKAHFASGGFARMYVGIDPKSEYLVAVKELTVKPTKKKMIGPTLALTRRDTVVRELIGASATERSYGPLRAVQNKKESKVYIIQNLLSGTVKDAIEDMARSCPRRSVVLICARAIMKDLKKLQDKQVMHFDLHSKNILYDRDKHAVEIIDFGGCEIGSSALPTCSSSKSTPHQQLEIFDCTVRNDVFTLGATFAEYATGCELFDGRIDENCLFSSRDFQNMRFGALSRAKQAHLDGYRAKLFALCPEFGQLCLDMLNMHEHLEMTVAQVADRVDALFESVDDADWVLFDAAWDRLPEYSDEIREGIEKAKLSVQSIRTKKLTRVA